jgi:NTP pyrophosphatase (non-canonical NTP hydrolase)
MKILENINLNELNELSQYCYQQAKIKGFYDGYEYQISEKLLLIITEISELYEVYRRQLKDETLADIIHNGYEKKDSFVDEVADVFIRLFDFCGKLDIDIAKQVKWKLDYNKERPYKHGKAF